MALMGRDLLAKLQTSINLPFLDPISVLYIQMAPEPLASPQSQNLSPDLPLIDPWVWDTEAPSIARHHSEMKEKGQDFHLFLESHPNLNIVSTNVRAS